MGEVEDELFRFARVFEGNDELRTALSDPAIPAERRQAVVEELLGGKALAVSRAIASFVVGIGRVNDLPAVVNRLVEIAAESRSHEVAEVRSAVPLDDDQQRRLAAALGEATGKQVEIKLIVDPRVLGGIVARVGDVVIDGSVRHRLEQLKEQI
ncbi:MAG: ATP synthase F1 subunit delta [Acidimicrobiia bacterium]|nr:ATP synthase F1 subunit delta [Acidimicrobiia bacterium]